MRTVRLRPDQSGKLLVAQAVRGTMKDVQDLLLPPRELMSRSGTRAAPVPNAASRIALTEGRLIHNRASQQGHSR
jgi:hypothetical protein